jgi:hypothetical protein
VPAARTEPAALSHPKFCVWQTRSSPRIVAAEDVMAAPVLPRERDLHRLAGIVSEHRAVAAYALALLEDEDSADFEAIWRAVPCAMPNSPNLPP